MTACLGFLAELVGEREALVTSLPEIFQRLLNGDIVGAYEIADDVPKEEGSYILTLQAPSTLARTWCSA